MVGDKQESPKKEARTHAGLRRAGEWHSAPVGEAIEKGNGRTFGRPAGGPNVCRAKMYAETMYGLFHRAPALIDASKHGGITTVPEHSYVMSC